MGLHTRNLYLYHGTQTAFDSVRLPSDPGFVSAVGQGSGAAFYTFATTDPALIETARDNARSFASNGMVLAGVAQPEHCRIIDGTAELGEELASMLCTALQQIQTGDALLDRYYRHLAQTLHASQTGRDAWSRIQGNVHLKQWLTESAATGMGENHEINAVLKQDRQVLNRLLESRDIPAIADMGRIESDQRGMIAASLRALPTNHPAYAKHYEQIAQKVEAGKIATGTQIFEQMSRPEMVQRTAKDSALDGIRMPSDALYDKAWITIINGLGIAGISYRMDGALTALFQGDVGIKQLPALHVEELHGHPPEDKRTHPCPIKLGDVLVQRGGGRLGSDTPESVIAARENGNAAQQDERLRTSLGSAKKINDIS